jgi:hypothetical protein
VWAWCVRLVRACACASCVRVCACARARSRRGAASPPARRPPPRSLARQPIVLNFTSLYLTPPLPNPPGAGRAQGRGPRPQLPRAGRARPAGPRVLDPEAAPGAPHPVRRLFGLCFCAAGPSCRVLCGRAWRRRALFFWALFLVGGGGGRGRGARAPPPGGVPGVHDPLDPEYSILKQRLARRIRCAFVAVWFFCRLLPLVWVSPALRAACSLGLLVPRAAFPVPERARLRGCASVTGAERGTRVRAHCAQVSATSTCARVRVHAARSQTYERARALGTAAPRTRALAQTSHMPTRPPATSSPTQPPNRPPKKLPRSYERLEPVLMDLSDMTAVAERVITDVRLRLGFALGACALGACACGFSGRRAR